MAMWVCLQHIKEKSLKVTTIMPEYLVRNLQSSKIAIALLGSSFSFGLWAHWAKKNTRCQPVSRPLGELQLTKDLVSPLIWVSSNSQTIPNHHPPFPVPSPAESMWADQMPSFSRQWRTKTSSPQLSPVKVNSVWSHLEFKELSSVFVCLTDLCEASWGHGGKRFDQVRPWPMWVQSMLW